MDEITGSHSGPASGPAFLYALAQASGDIPPSLLAVLFAGVLVIVLSFLASMTEAAFLSLSMLKAQGLLESKNRFDRLAGSMRLNFAKPLATIVVINNIANIAGSALFGSLAQGYLEAQSLPVTASTAFGIVSALLTFAVILAGEIVPKTIGERHNKLVVRIMSPVVRANQVAMTPIIWIVGITQKPFLRVGARHVTSEEEIQRLTELGQEQGAIEADEHRMIQRVFRLNDLTAEDVMTSRVEMVGLAADQTLGDVAAELGEINRSRIPLYGENRDEIVAVLDRMDALLELAKDRPTLPLSHNDVSFRPLFIPESMPADDLLVALQRRTEPMAIVVGEYGETVGLVTLEDVIEELVGEIVDEQDLDDGESVERLNDQEAMCDGRAEVNELNRALGTEVPNHRTVAGLLLDEMERIPAVGETHEAHGVLFSVTEATDRAIIKIHARRVPTEAESTAADGQQSSDAA